MYSFGLRYYVEICGHGIDIGVMPRKEEFKVEATIHGSYRFVWAQDLVLDLLDSQFRPLSRVDTASPHRPLTQLWWHGVPSAFHAEHFHREAGQHFFVEIRYAGHRQLVGPFAEADEGGEKPQGPAGRDRGKEGKRQEDGGNGDDDTNEEDEQVDDDGVSCCVERFDTPSGDLDNIIKPVKLRGLVIGYNVLAEFSRSKRLSVTRKDVCAHAVNTGNTLRGTCCKLRLEKHRTWPPSRTMNGQASLRRAPILWPFMR